MTDYKKNKAFGRLKIGEIVIPGAHHAGLTSVYASDALVQGLIIAFGLQAYSAYITTAVANYIIQSLAVP